MEYGEIVGIENTIKLLKEVAGIGTYAGVRFDKDTTISLYQYALENHIPNPVKPEEYHITLLYSRKYLPNYQPESCEMIATPQKLEVWKSSKALIKTPVLVLRVNCPELEERHKFLMGEHGATYDFPTYIPHITLSYDIEDFNISRLPLFNQNIKITREYMEELQTK